MPRLLRAFLRASATALTLAAFLAPVAEPARAQVSVVSAPTTAPIAPPPLPLYTRPPIPGPGYAWVPGYWAWDGQEYYWVPGYWMLPPATGLLWTPGYWSADTADNDYTFSDGYWAPTVGFYGGVDYGLDYPGDGFYGGYWQGDVFFYNIAVYVLIRAPIRTVYNRPPPHMPTSRVSYNGGQGGLAARPTGPEMVDAPGRRVPPTAAQARHQDVASGVPSQKFSANQGRPAMAAVARAGDLSSETTAAPGQAPATSPFVERPAAARGPGAAPAFQQRSAIAAPAYHGYAVSPAPATALGGAAGVRGFGNSLNEPIGGVRFGGAPDLDDRPRNAPIFVGGAHFGGAPGFAGGAHFNAPHFSGAGGGRARRP